MRRHVAVLILAVVLALSGCSVKAADVGVTPACPPGGRVDNALLTLMAQSVPTASLIPCVRQVPAGWSLSDPTVRRGKSSLVLDSDREGRAAVRVVLTRTCNTSAATRVPSDQPQAKRFERPTRLSGGFGGARYYVYPGGCTTFLFDLHGNTRAQPLTEIGAALTFVTRESIRQSVRRDTDGRLKLDVGQSS